ncbi:MAG: hypothetical protein LBT29_04230 [Flavobacteriaceae bacterium]|jgi:hypothetical protein|nr:hypothetical protein [Flavobacteriaceae bacterium]
MINFLKAKPLKTILIGIIIVGIGALAKTNGENPLGSIILTVGMLVELIGTIFLLRFLIVEKKL